MESLGNPHSTDSNHMNIQGDFCPRFIHFSNQFTLLHRSPKPNLAVTTVTPYSISHNYSLEEKIGTKSRAAIMITSKILVFFSSSTQMMITTMMSLPDKQSSKVDKSWTFCNNNKPDSKNSPTYSQPSPLLCSNDAHEIKFHFKLVQSQQQILANIHPTK